MRFLVALVVSLVLCPVSGQASVIVRETLITQDPYNQFAAAASGPLTVYTETRAGTNDLMGIDDTGSLFVVAVAPGSQDGADIDGNLVVYVDDTAGNKDVYLRDLVANTTQRLATNFGDDFDPRISGTNVLYVTRHGSTDDIYWFDLLAGEAMPLTMSTGKASAPVVDGALAAWAMIENGGSRVYAARLGSTPFVISAGSQYEFGPSVSGNLIAFISDRNVVVYDITTSQVRRITNDRLLRDKVLVSGEHVVWSDARNGNLDIFMYNMPEGLTYQLTTDPSDQVLTDISGNRVVYHDMRNGNLDVWSLTFEIHHAPTADAGPDQTVYTGSQVQLLGSATDADGNAIAAWRWTMQSTPTVSTASLVGAATATTTFTPDVPGDYVLSLEASDGADWSAPDYVTVHASANLPPIAIAAADLTSGPVLLSVRFDASQSRDPEGSTLTYGWNFGDLATSTEVSPVHVFAAPGHFLVQLTVTDSLGQTGTDTIFIEALPPLNHPPHVSPTATPVSGAAPLPVVFAATASDADGDALTFSWDFGDASSVENTSGMPNPSHTYPNPGTYTAWLTVSDGKVSASVALTIVVSPSIKFDVTRADIDFKSKKSALADVEIQAEVYAAIPAPDEVVALYVDDALVFAAPFSRFDPAKHHGIAMPDVYELKAKHLWVQIDFASGRLAVGAEKATLAGYDPTNGVDVEIMLGSGTAVDNVKAIDDGRGERHYRHRRSERGHANSWH